MEILDLDQCDFIQYRPADGGAPEEFVVTNLKRDHEWFARNLPIMKAFWDRVIAGRKVGFTCEVIDEPPRQIEPEDPVCEIVDEVQVLQEGAGDSEMEILYFGPVFKLHSIRNTQVSPIECKKGDAD